MRYIYIILFAAIISFCSCDTQIEIRDPKIRLITPFSSGQLIEDSIKKAILEPSARLEVSFGNNSSAGVFGSAVAIKTVKQGNMYRVYLVTARHVIRYEGANIKARFFFGDSGDYIMPVKLAALSGDSDLALLVGLSDRNISPARILKPGNSGSIEVFSEVYTVGCKLGTPPSPSEGIISGTSINSAFRERLWMTTASTIYGNSGGGVFLKETGELAGIVVSVAIVKTELFAEPGGQPVGKASLHPVSHMGFFVPASKLADFINNSNLQNHGD